MRASERERLERERLRRALGAAREALHCFPAEAVRNLTKGPLKSKLESWVGASRNTAIYQISVILGDVPLAQLDPLDPGPFKANPNEAADRARLTELCNKLGGSGYW